MEANKYNKSLLINPINIPPFSEQLSNTWSTTTACPEETSTRKPKETIATTTSTKISSRLKISLTANLPIRTPIPTRRSTIRIREPSLIISRGAQWKIDSLKACPRIMMHIRTTRTSTEGLRRSDKPITSNSATNRSGLRPSTPTNSRATLQSLKPNDIMSLATKFFQKETLKVSVSTTTPIFTTMPKENLNSDLKENSK